MSWEPNRIGHGLSAAADPRLLAHLAQRSITLEICPTSNLRTGAVDSLAEHPLPRLLAAGVPVTVASDDPGMFHTDLGREHLLLHTEFGLDLDQVAAIVRTGVDASFCSPPRRATLHAGITAALAQAR